MCNDHNYRVQRSQCPPPPHPPPREYSYVVLLVRLYLLHLLDVAWQEYDNTLLSELQLADLFLETAISERLSAT